ncbi:TPA: CsbD family protein [Enterobacter mori]|nr:CsbD family protein [Enterobacter mori]
MFTKSADKNQEKLGDMEGSFGGAINPSEHPVIETAKKYAAQTNDAIRSHSDDIKSKIKSNPRTCIAILTSVAFTLGFLLGRR